MVLWRQEVDTVEKKAELDPVHLWFYGDGIWIQWEREQNWFLYINCILETEYGYSGIGYMYIFEERKFGTCTFMVYTRDRIRIQWIRISFCNYFQRGL